MSYGITRKRRRSAVDPCLGYYPEGRAIEEDEAEPADIPTRRSKSVKSRKNNAKRGHWKDGNPETSFAQGLQSISDPIEGSFQIGVEDFLRTNANTSMSVQRGRRRRTAMVNDVIAGATLDPSPPAISSPIKITSTRQMHTRSKRFAKRVQSSPRRNTREESDGAYSQSDNVSLPGIAVLDCGSDSDDPDSLGLQGEGHLHLRSRNIRRGRIVGDSNSSGNDSESNLGKTTPSVQKARAKPKRTRLRTKSLGARLFEASIATHGDPLDSLIIRPPEESDTNDGPQTQRKPLRFRPMDEKPLSASPALLTKRTLVDPRRTIPFRNASFCPGGIRDGPLNELQPESVELDSLSYKAVSKWRPGPSQNYASAVTPKKSIKRKRRPREEGPKISLSAYQPLNFVPISEAEGANRQPLSQQV